MTTPAHAHPTPESGAQLTGNTLIGQAGELDRTRPPLTPITDGMDRPQPTDGPGQDEAGWRKLDAGVSRSCGWASIDDARAGADGGMWGQT
jgi:hypothetical protein